MSLLHPRTILMISVLTLAVWLLEYYAMPDYPLSGDETTVVAGVCALMVIVSKWVLTALRDGLRHT
jgi:hypothetical protein